MSAGSKHNLQRTGVVLGDLEERDLRDSMLVAVRDANEVAVLPGLDQSHENRGQNSQMPGHFLGVLLRFHRGIRDGEPVPECWNTNSESAVVSRRPTMPAIVVGLVPPT
jgi:hypothetical protein